jgi:Holliday junction DNA helicase RuvA
VIAHLRGRILEKQPTRVVVDVAGVGYDVAVPLSTFYGLGEPGAEVALRVHTHVREDALALYGFATVLELDLFNRLISISGIGPKLALAVLSGIEPPDLVGAIERGDVARPNVSCSSSGIACPVRTLPLRRPPVRRPTG